MRHPVAIRVDLKAVEPEAPTSARYARNLAEVVSHDGALPVLMRRILRGDAQVGFVDGGVNPRKSGDDQ